jgi:hypothetical protein
LYALSKGRAVCQWCSGNDVLELQPFLAEIGHETDLADGAQCTGAQLDPHHPIEFGNKQTLRLDVGALPALALVVSVGHIVAGKRLFAGNGATTAHRDAPFRPFPIP